MRPLAVIGNRRSRWIVGMFSCGILNLQDAVAHGAAGCGKCGSEKNGSCSERSMRGEQLSAEWTARGGVNRFEEERVRTAGKSGAGEGDSASGTAGRKRA
jgi:hypothetical protein